jgi:hypothetical protein
MEIRKKPIFNKKVKRNQQTFGCRLIHDFPVSQNLLFVFRVGFLVWGLDSLQVETFKDIKRHLQTL